MSFNYRVAGYVKLAKLWEKNKEAALSYHKRYYKEKCDKIPGWIFQGVYVDITGQKLIYKRPQMSVRVPDGFLELHRSFKIHSKQFVYETLIGWGLNPEKTYSFKGEYLEEQKMVVFCLKSAD